MTTIDEIVGILPKCPKCGASAKLVEQYNEVRVQCSASDNCYKTPWYSLNPRHCGTYSFGQTHEEKLLYVIADWVKKSLEYPAKKSYRDSLEARRCECGKVPSKNAMFCPNCGKPVNEE